MKNTIIRSIGETIYKEFLSFKFKTKTERGYYKLIYLGQDGQRFHIGYREFTSDSIRTHFSENFTFEVSHDEPTEISFRNKLFTVIKVTNKNIEFIDSTNS